MTQPNTDRLNQIAKRQINAMLRQDVRGEVLALAWRALAETVRQNQGARS